MKKIIFGILSILLISPVFAVDYSPSWTYNTAISFESLTQNNNITYYLYNYGGNGSYFGYLTNGFSIGELIPKYLSLEQSGYGSSINSDYVGNIFKFGSLNDSNSFNQYYSLLAFTLSGGLPKLGYNSLYLQSTSSSVTNKLVAFGNNELDYNDSVSLSNSYVRYFYNTGLLFDGLTPNYSDFYSNPVGVQIFGSALYTLTNKGKIYDYAGVGSINKNWVLSSYYDGYSYVLGSGDNLSFYTVLPGISQFVSGSYVVPNYFQTDKFLMFRGDGNKYNGDYSIVGVLSFSGSNLLYSKYSCNGLSLTLLDDGKYLYNFYSACSLLDGGIVNSGGRVYFQRCGYFDIKDFFSRVKQSLIGCNPNNYYGNYLSLSFDSNNNLVLSSLSEINISNTTVERYSIRVPLTSIYGVDILSGFDNTAVPVIPPTIEESIDSLQNLYCIQNPTSPYCNGIYTGSRDEVRCVVNNSGFVNCYFTDFARPTVSEDCPTIKSGLDNGQVFIQYWSTGENRCIQGVSASIIDSSPDDDLTSELTGLENSINLAFSGIISGGNFKFYSCPFNSPLKAFHLSSIGGLSSFLLDKFFDVNLVGPFNCFFGGLLYSEVDSDSIGKRLLLGAYDGEKLFNSFSEDTKSTISWLLFAGMVLFFWAFRPKEH